MIDLRSDTITKPSPAMLEVMTRAQVGDDVFDEDPTVIELQQKAARQFGMQAGLFCPSGTMTNQIAIRILTQPQHELICDEKSHIYKYEGGGIAYNSFTSVCLVHGDRGRIAPEQIEENIRPDDIHEPITSLVCLENTVNKAGGSYYTIDQIGSIHEVCKKHQLQLHLDGARVFNALVETGERAEDLGACFDTISICLSKGLGAPVGSLILSTQKNIQKAKRIRKVFGGAMRQAGYLAAAGIYALENNVSRLKEDHRRAKILGETLENLPFEEYVLPVDTNIVIFKLSGNLFAEKVLMKMKEKRILALPFGKKDIRFVTHLDYSDDQLDQTIQLLKSLRL